MQILKTIIFLLSFAAGAQGAQYFSKPIDYWNSSKKPAAKAEPKKVEQPTAPLSTTEPTTTPKGENKAFDWDKHANPKNDEFFKEGDYTPPPAFMELARNPNDENINRWFAMIEAKNKLMAKLQERIANYLQKSGKGIGDKEKQLLEQKKVALEPSSANTKRFRFRMYFDSTCPHCSRMMGTMKDLQDLGFYVEVRQIDKRPPSFPVPFPITPATPEEVKEKHIDSWPVLFIADIDTQQLYRINGYLPANEVLNTLGKK